MTDLERLENIDEALDGRGRYSEDDVQWLCDRLRELLAEPRLSTLGN